MRGVLDRKEARRARAPELPIRHPKKAKVKGRRFGIYYRYVYCCSGFTRWYETETGRDQALARMRRATVGPAGRRRPFYVELLKLERP